MNSGIRHLLIIALAEIFLTNEAGAYNILGLIPGTYSVSGELPGFQKQTYQNVVLGNAVTVRLNFSLQVSAQATSVEVTIAADITLATSSGTVGTVLTEKRVRDLPVVGNNVLDMLNLLGGLDNYVQTGGPGQSAFGREATTLAGVSAQAVPVIRDGVMVQDQRYPTGINTATVMNQDLVGEIRLIVAPVDAELGRGNGAVQISTRSGTNQFHGAATWNIQNTALNPNTWSNNRAQPRRIEPAWININEGTGAFGGPIVKNKTFFYGVWNMNFNRQRATTYASVLTPCARNGIFRYFDGVNSCGYGAATVGGATPTTAVVDTNGNPFPPAPGAQLRHISVFGPATFTGGAPNADCSNAVVSGSWDQFRTRKDTTGFIDRTLALMPVPNDFSAAPIGPNSVDGLNVANFRSLRRFTGLNNLFAVGEGTGNRKQINLRGDHVFNQSHKLNAGFTYERVDSDDVVSGLPGTWANKHYTRPFVFTAALISSLSASIVNEARFGYKTTGSNVVAPWDRPENDELGINEYLPQPINGFKILPDLLGAVGLCNPITGARPTGGQCSQGNANGANLTATARDKTPSWTYGDTLSWAKGTHSFKAGGEVRFNASRTQFSSPGNVFFTNNKMAVVVAGGAAPGAPLLTAGPTAIANTNPAMSGLQTNDATRARNLLNLLSGSLQSINNTYMLTDPNATTFSDYRELPLAENELRQREYSLFFKDDYKVARNLTLNLGIRYDWYGVPFVASGLTVAPVGSAFGYSGNDFSSWMVPGARRGDDTTLQFVGPNSPNPDKTVYRNDTNNFGPAAGFSWQLPWLGQDKTTIRGGYQITFQGGGRFNALEGALSNPPGRTYPGTYGGDSSNLYLDLSKIASYIPTPVPVRPMAPIPITDRNTTISFFDQNYTSPYTQNLTLALTRSISSNMTFDVRYIGTLSKKLYTQINLNSPNFLYNGLIAELDRVRTGGESPLLDRMFAGINICAAGCAAGQTYGPVGTSGQTAAYQMRSSTTFQTNLANGNYSAIATSLNTLNYVKTATANQSLPNVPSTVRGSVLRFNAFPENFIATNPQYSTVNYLSNMSSSNYHSLQAEYTLRPINGMTGSVNYTWSKNLGYGTTFTNPLERRADYTIVNNNHPHALRTNGVFELPIGPNKMILGNSSGVLARALERWQLGIIYTLTTGNWNTIATNNSLYANGVPDIVNNELFQELLEDKGVRWGVPAGNNAFLEGRYFDPAKWVKVADPQCATVTAAQNLNGGAVQRCTLQALARVTANGNVIVLQNPQPGTRGNLGRNVFREPAVFRFDANLSKSFQISEGKTLQFRADVTNVLNHPQPGGASLTLNSVNAATPFGQITTKTGARTIQGQLRFAF